MSTNKQRLELTWIGKNNPEYDISNIEPRILEERIDLSYGDKNTGNMIIHGDNMLALKALLPEYEDKVQCVYIDPPYNTGHAFEHYDDSVEHSVWLSLMKPRLELLKNLLNPEQGSIWISIDDDESHYLKILCDEIFGRGNFVANVIWEKKHTRANDAKWFSDNHDHILVYARNKQSWKRNLLPRHDEEKGFTNIDDDPRGPWASGPCHVKTPNPKDIFPVTTPSGRVIMPPAGTSWRFSKEKFDALIRDNKIYFGTTGSNVPRYKRFLSEVQDGLVPLTLWFREEVGDNQEAKSEIKKLFGEDPFGTPKPERLMKRIFELSTKPGDIILDSFLGSGTASAVAQKMNRKYIGIEMGEHAYTHVQSRMKKVVDGSDGLKLSEELDWKGGGGFRFYELAPSFVTTDEFGNSVIDSYYNDTKLIQALCKLLNFTFKPSQTEYWKQGIGQGKNYVYVTTQTLSPGIVEQIKSHLKPDESLMICAKKFEPGCESVDGRIIIKKIPQSILKACHFGKKEYLLPIKEVSLEELDVESEDEE